MYLSAMTNPTVSNTPEAGKNGRSRRTNAIPTTNLSLYIAMMIMLGHWYSQFTCWSVGCAGTVETRSDRVPENKGFWGH